MKINSAWSLRYCLLFFIFIINTFPIINAQAVRVYPADSFVEIIGVNTHWIVPNVYTHNYTTLKAKLVESGIRYIRDGANAQTYL